MEYRICNTCYDLSGKELDLIFRGAAQAEIHEEISAGLEDGWLKHKENERYIDGMDRAVELVDDIKSALDSTDRQVLIDCIAMASHEGYWSHSQNINDFEERAIKLAKLFGATDMEIKCIEIGT